MFLFAPHIELIDSCRRPWPGLPSQVIDAVTVVTLVAMVVVLVDRVTNPVKRICPPSRITSPGLVTFLPLADRLAGRTASAVSVYH